MDLKDLDLRGKRVLSRRGRKGQLTGMTETDEGMFTNAPPGGSIQYRKPVKGQFAESAKGERGVMDEYAYGAGGFPRSMTLRGPGSGFEGVPEGARVDERGTARWTDEAGVENIRFKGAQRKRPKKLRGKPTLAGQGFEDRDGFEQHVFKKIGGNPFTLKSREEWKRFKGAGGLEKLAQSLFGGDVSFRAIEEGRLTDDQKRSWNAAVMREEARVERETEEKRTDLKRSHEFYMERFDARATKIRAAKERADAKTRKDKEKAGKAVEKAKTKADKIKGSALKEFEKEFAQGWYDDKKGVFLDEDDRPLKLNSADKSKYKRILNQSGKGDLISIETTVGGMWGSGTEERHYVIPQVTPDNIEQVQAYIEEMSSTRDPEIAKKIVAQIAAMEARWTPEQRKEAMDVREDLVSVANGVPVTIDRASTPEEPAKPEAVAEQVKEEKPATSYIGQAMAAETGDDVRTEEAVTPEVAVAETKTEGPIPEGAGVPSLSEVETVREYLAGTTGAKEKILERGFNANAFDHHVAEVVEQFGLQRSVVVAAMAEEAGLDNELTASLLKKHLESGDITAKRKAEMARKREAGEMPGQVVAKAEKAAAKDLAGTGKTPELPEGTTIEAATKDLASFMTALNKKKGSSNWVRNWKKIHDAINVARRTGVATPAAKKSIKKALRAFGIKDASARNKVYRQMIRELEGKQ
jgi:hypothetical protein